MSSSDQLNLNNQIAGNFTSFLTLLTTQLQNQNPLDPLDTNQFTQLVQFGRVERSIRIRSRSRWSAATGGANTQALTLSARL
jgi:flagellar basal-body rod modification protein FlgD